MGFFDFPVLTNQYVSQMKEGQKAHPLSTSLRLRTSKNSPPYEIFVFMKPGCLMETLPLLLNLLTSSSDDIIKEYTILRLNVSSNKLLTRFQIASFNQISLYKKASSTKELHLLICKMLSFINKICIIYINLSLKNTKKVL